MATVIDLVFAIAITAGTVILIFFKIAFELFY